MNHTHICAVAACAGMLLVQSVLAQFAATGWVRVEKVGERYTLVDADGKPFFSAGANHAQLFLFMKENNREATIKRYGEELIDPKTQWFNRKSAAFTRLLDAQIENLKDWKFNTFGYHTDAAICERTPDDVFFIATFRRSSRRQYTTSCVRRNCGRTRLTRCLSNP